MGLGVCIWVLCIFLGSFPSLSLFYPIVICLFSLYFIIISSMSVCFFSNERLRDEKVLESDGKGVREELRGGEEGKR